MSLDPRSQLGMGSAGSVVGRISGLGAALALALLLPLSGCLSKAPTSDAMPAIVIRPGAAERIALMDAYRLNDDIRKRMMARPRVWVEEVSEDELPEDAAAGEAASAAEPASSAPAVK